MKNNWDQGSWQRIKKGNNVMMISLHGGRTSRIFRWFIIFRVEQHAKRGGRLGGRKKTAWSSRITIVADANIPSSMLGTMLKHGGGRTTSQASKDGNNSSTLSLSLSF
jgi:hypothetical protein